MFKRKLIVLVLVLFVLFLAGFSTKPLDSQVFDLKNILPEENWTNKKEKYYFIENYEDFKLLHGAKVFLYEEDVEKIDEDFFEDKMLIFVLVSSSQGIESLNVQTSFKRRNLQIEIEVNSLFTMQLDSKAIGIVVQKANVKNVKLEIIGA